MNLLASRVAGAATAFAAVALLAVSAVPGIAQTADATGGATFDPASTGGVVQGSGGHNKWHAGAENSDSVVFFGTGKDVSRAEKKALHKCRTSSKTRKAGSCHIYNTWQGNPGGVGLVEIGRPDGPSHKWHANAENRSHFNWSGDDKQRSRAKKQALDDCRSASAARDRKSCHITEVYFDDGHQGPTGDGGASNPPAE